MTMFPWQPGSASDAAMHLRGAVDGALFMGQSALALAATLATVLLLAAVPLRRAAGSALVFTLAAVAAGWLPVPVPWGAATTPAVLLLLGACVAAGLRLRGIAGWIAVVVGGVAAGIAGGLQTATWEETAGGIAVLYAALLAGLGLGGHVVLPQGMQRGAALACRMAGAWIAAVGVLMLAMWLRRG